MHPAGLAQIAREAGFDRPGYNWPTDIRGRPGFDVVDPSG
jgi:hypothetical protein